MRRLTALFTCTVLSACGGDGMPTSPAPPPAPSAIAPGRYMVTLLAAPVPAEPLRPDCTPMQFTPEGAAPLSVFRFRGIAVDDGSGGILLRPEPEMDAGLEFRLRRTTGNAVAGTIAGGAREWVFRQLMIVDGGSPEIPAQLTGLRSGLPTLVGDLSGRMLFPAFPDASCRAGRWMMTPE